MNPVAADVRRLKLISWHVKWSLLTSAATALAERENGRQAQRKFSASNQCARLIFRHG
jgi:hypothetical protein